MIDTLRKEGEIKDLRLEDVSIDVNAEVVDNSDFNKVTIFYDKWLVETNKS